MLNDFSSHAVYERVHNIGCILRSTRLGCDMETEEKVACGEVVRQPYLLADETE